MNNKKGVSPLIATVMIVGIVIALSFLVTTWITGSVEDTIDDTDCEMEAQERCSELTSAVKLSVNGAGNKLIVSNEGATDIKGSNVVHYDKDGNSNSGSEFDLSAYKSNINTSIGSSDIAFKVFMVGTDADELCSVECSPVLLEL